MSSSANADKMRITLGEAMEDTKRLRELCEQVSREQDSEKFLVLARELNRLLGEREKAKKEQEGPL